MSFLDLLAAPVPDALTEEDYARYCCPAHLERIAGRSEKGRIPSCVGQMLLGTLLKGRGCVLDAPPALGYGEVDKPFLTDFPGLYFNVSHSGGWVVCALSDCEVGVDIQEERKLHTSLLRKLHPSEQTMLETLPDEAFFDLWALKESFCKCTGEGLLRPLRESCFTLEPVTIDQRGYQAALLEFPVKGLHLAVCARCEALPEIQLNMLNM